jgi:hypothetical protein
MKRGLTELFLMLLVAGFAFCKGVDGFPVWAEGNDLTIDQVVLIAENEVEEDSAGRREDSEREVKPDERKSSKSKSKPLKRFVPSEKIKAGQGVDFPYDI